jgi:hypothetical protein
MKTFTKKEDKLASLLAWLACHVDEDVEFKSKHVRQSLNDSVNYLEEIKWYDYNKNKKEVA